MHEKNTSISSPSVVSFGLYLSITEGMFLYHWSMHNIFKFLALTFKYLGTTLTDQTSIQEEIKRRLNSGNVFYHSAQNLSSSCLLSKYIKIRIYRTIILPVVLCGCESWSLTLREEHRLRVFENRFLRRIFGSKRDEVTRGWRKLHNDELHNLYSSPGIIRMIMPRTMRMAGHVA
jgi:hypothetical protein